MNAEQPPIHSQLCESNLNFKQSSELRDQIRMHNKQSYLILSIVVILQTIMTHGFYVQQGRYGIKDYLRVVVMLSNLVLCISYFISLRDL